MLFKFSRILIASALAVQTAFAQNVPSVTPITTGSTFIGAPGNYNMNNVSQDNTKIMLELLNQLKNIQQQDREYLLGLVTRFNEQLKEMVLSVNAFYSLSLSGQTGFIKIEDYLTLVKKIREQASLLGVDISTYTVVTRESLPSYTPMQAGGATATPANFGNLNLGPLTKRVEAVREQLLKDANNLKFKNLRTSRNQIVQITENALAPNFPNLVILSADEIQAMEEQIVLLNTPKRETSGLFQRYVDRSVTNILNFVQNYGNREWLRFRNANDEKALKETFQGILDGFFYRSYLRKKYGIRLGAIQTKGYPKNIINIESFGIQPLREALKSFDRNLAITESDVANAFENARNFVELYDAKVTPVFASRKDILDKPGKQDDYSSNDTGFLVRANAALTWITGQTHVAEILLMVMRLTLADIREEMMLMRGDRLALIGYHDARYRATESYKKTNNIKICQTDWTLPQSIHDSVCKPLGVSRKAQRVQGTGGGTLLENFSLLLGQLENVERARKQEATRLQEVIDASQAATRSKEEEDELGDLFK